MRLRTICFSVLLHIIVIVILTVGTSWIPKKKKIAVPPHISVEIITIAKKTQTKKKSVKKSHKKTLKKTAKKIKKVEKKTPAKAATNKNKTMTTPTVSNPVQLEKKKDAKPKKITKSLKVPKKPPVRKPPKKVKKLVSEQEFSSVLKNLADGQIKTEKLEGKKPLPKKKESVSDFLDKLNLDNEPDKAHDLPLGTTLTIGEMDLLRRQLSNCWSIPIGARDAENLAIDIFMVVNSDRTVHHAKIVDQSQYQQDGFFRAAADSALRAVYNPECSPLELPEDKYTLWNEIIVTFDPQNMF